jgi:hypothetical protein
MIPFIGKYANITMRFKERAAERRVQSPSTMHYLRKLLLVLKAIIGVTSKLVAGLIGLLAAAVVTSKEDDSEDGDLTGNYNFRTRKFDNGTDPYGWYEDDL